MNKKTMFAMLNFCEKLKFGTNDPSENKPELFFSDDILQSLCMESVFPAGPMYHLKPDCHA